MPWTAAVGLRCFYLQHFAAPCATSQSYRRSHVAIKDLAGLLLFQDLLWLAPGCLKFGCFSQDSAGATGAARTPNMPDFRMANVYSAGATGATGAARTPNMPGPTSVVPMWVFMFRLLSVAACRCLWGCLCKTEQRCSVGKESREGGRQRETQERSYIISKSR